MNNLEKNEHFWDWVNNKHRQQEDAYQPVSLYIDDTPPPRRNSEDDNNNRSDRGIVEVDTVVFQM